MAYHSDFDFVGNYDHRRGAGMLHVANHHLVPGKKQWTWGCSDFGQAWDRQLTDEDGPYIELMCGAFTDNQPDFSWIQPGEEKSFTQIFMPYKQVGAVKNASSEAVLNLEVAGGQAHLGVYVTRPRQVTVRLAYRDVILYEKSLALDPQLALTESVLLPAGAVPQDLALSVLDGEGELLSYTPLPDEKPDIPAPAQPAPAPEQVASNDELFLHGLHLEQYRHATREPEAYYLEALRRDPLDSRCNNALGLLLYRRGVFAQAETHFRAAIQRQTQRNPNPYDGEPYYNLGLALTMQGRFREAFDAFYKAVWNAAWQDAAYFQLARLACLQGDIPQAQDLLEHSLGRNCRHHQARHLKTALLRRQGQAEAARKEVEYSLSIDALDYGALWEQHLLTGDSDFWQITRREPNICIEVALDYAHAGLWHEAIHLLEQAPAEDALVRYTLGWVLLQSGDLPLAEQVYREAAALPTDYVFPNRLEDVLILSAAEQLHPQDARACYYLGNFWYAHRQYDDAIACWEHVRQLDPQFPTVHRNLGLAYFNKRAEPSLALQSLERAFELDPQDARLLFELDQLYKKLNRPPAERLAHLELNPALVEARDDLMIERISLHNLLGDPQRAYQLLMGRNFHPWEGGEGKTTGQYVASLVEIARRHLRAGDYAAARQLLERARSYPPSLGEGKLYGAQENNIFYYLGIACLGLEEAEQARLHFERASVGISEPASAMYYNDQPPDMIYYQGLARRELGFTEAASEIFHKLIDYGQTHLDDPVQVDYFAVSLPDFLVFEDDLQRRNKVHCHYMQALGAMGCGENATARMHFEQVLRLDLSHLGATLHLRILAEQDE
jgi:tetratricopeptide (TPR) repeat protein